MEDMPLQRHYGPAFGRFLTIWIMFGVAGLMGIVFYFIAGPQSSDDPVTVVGAISMVVFGLVLYSFPSVLACASVHPSRSGIYFVPWFMGWTGIGWLVALIWAFVGFNERKRRLEVTTVLNLPEESRKGSSLSTLLTVTAVCLLGFLILACLKKPLRETVSNGIINAVSDRGSSKGSERTANFSVDDLPGQKGITKGIR